VAKILLSRILGRGYFDSSKCTYLGWGVQICRLSFS